MKQVKKGGKFTSAERKKLPSSAFGLPKERKYPMKKKVGGKLVASRSHAANAKARAEQEVKKGNLSTSEQDKIDRKANKILGKSGDKTMKSKKKTKTKPTKGGKY